jgi:hypothetical protein
MAAEVDGLSDVYLLHPSMMHDTSSLDTQRRTFVMRSVL